MKGEIHRERRKERRKERGEHRNKKVTSNLDKENKNLFLKADNFF
jgi:hypothetical protein